MDETVSLNKNYDLVHSSWDERETGKGWYFMRYPETLSSKESYETKEDAFQAFKEGMIEWEEVDNG